MDLQWHIYIDLSNGHKIVNPHNFNLKYLKSAIDFISKLPRPLHKPPPLKLANVNHTYINIIPGIPQYQPQRIDLPEPLFNDCGLGNAFAGEHGTSEASSCNSNHDGSFGDKHDSSDTGNCDSQLHYLEDAEDQETLDDSSHLQENDQEPHNDGQDHQEHDREPHDYSNTEHEQDASENNQNYDYDYSNTDQEQNAYDNNQSCDYDTNEQNDYY